MTMRLTESISLIEGDVDRVAGVLEPKEVSGEMIKLDISRIGDEGARGGPWNDGDDDGVNSAAKEVMTTED